MRNKILSAVIIILVALLVFQTAYLFNLKRTQRIWMTETTRYPHAPTYAVEVDYYPIFDRIWGRDPFREMELMQKKMSRIFEDRFARPIEGRSASASQRTPFFKPAMDVKQTEAAYILSIDLPGIQKSEINIEVKQGYLTISGERKTQEKEQKKGFYRQELSCGNFFRAIALPEDAITKEISSEYKNGVLAIKIPKKVNLKPEEVPSIKVPVK